MHIFFKALCAVSHGMVTVTFICCFYVCTIANLTKLQVLDLVYEAIPYLLQLPSSVLFYPAEKH